MSIECVNERELLSSAAQGSQVAYRELIHLHQNAVYRFAWALIGEEHAQHVTENAFLTTWRQLEHFKTFNMSLRERLFQLVCIDCAQLSKHQLRHRINLPSTNEDALNFPFPPMRYDPRTNMEHLALQTDIEEALRMLPFQYRQVLLLHEMGDLADTQIADIIGDSAQNVHNNLALARGFVRRQIFLNGGFFPLSTEEAPEGKAVQYRACKEYLPFLAAAADDLCTAAEKQTLNAHFITCPGCQSYYESLRAIHHGISVMKREIPADIASYVMGRIQQESGSGDQDAPVQTRRKYHFRPVFGKFTIIGLCLALILLTYSNGFLQHSEKDNGDLQSTTSQDAPAPARPQEDKTPPVSDTTPKEPSAPTQEDPVQDEGTPSDPSVPDSSQSSHPEGESIPDNEDSAIIPGGSGTSSTVIPEGETYAALYTVDVSAEPLLTQYCSFSFRSTLTDGTNLMYYIIPVANSDALTSALEEASITPTPYTQDGAVDSTAENMLYITPLAH